MIHSIARTVRFIVNILYMECVFKIDGLELGPGTCSVFLACPRSRILSHRGHMASVNRIKNTMDSTLSLHVRIILERHFIIRSYLHGIILL